MGSSPRGRGKRAPSHATAARSWAHPRVGGENPLHVSRRLSKSGSSPRGRGKLHRKVNYHGTHGLIPAWAGKTAGEVTEDGTLWAHPRVGGENPMTREYLGAADGSSPRGRGKRAWLSVFSQPRRLIPAWAGKTQDLNLRPPGSGAHPRVGGENSCTFMPISILNRLIPAWAGKTCNARPPGPPPGAHPRVGGENTF